MHFRTLGATGLEVSVVGLGTWQFGGEWGKTFTQPEVDRIVGRAADLGINLIDTAECYGDHVSEALVGRAIAADRDRWVVATKFGHRFHPDRANDPAGARTDHWSPREVVEQLEASLRALGTDHVDVLQAHGGSDEQLWTEGLWETLQEQVAAGKVRHLGVSLDPPQADRARRAPEVGATVVQVPLSRLVRTAEGGVLPVCEELGLGVLAREPLANGYLSGRYRPGGWVSDPADWRSGHDRAEADATLEEVARIEAEEVPDGMPLARWALAWALRRPGVTAVIPGARHVEQVEGNAAAAELL